MPPKAPRKPTSWFGSYRASVQTLLIGIGLFLVVRNLPPDQSLAKIQANKVLSLCHPPTLEPFFNRNGGEVGGTEAELFRRIAAGLSVPPQFNLQAGWGQGADPVDWGLRPESCDAVMGGVLVSRETSRLMELLPYQQSQWVLLGNGPRVAAYTPFWGIEPDRFSEWVSARGFEQQFVDDAADTVRQLESGRIGGVVTLKETADWINRQLASPLPVQSVTGLARPTLAVGLWKGRTTLKRAVLKQLGVR